MHPLAQRHGEVLAKDDLVVEDEAALERREDRSMHICDVRRRPVPAAPRRNGVEGSPIRPCVGYGRVGGVIRRQREGCFGTVTKVNVHCRRRGGRTLGS